MVHWLKKSTYILLMVIITPQIMLASFTRLCMVLNNPLLAWFSKFSAIIGEFGFASSSHDFALAIRKTDWDTILLLIYVDDILLGISEIKKYLSQHIEMKDLGKFKYFLWLEITSILEGYYLYQAKYSSYLLTCTSLTDNKTIPLYLSPIKLTPMDGTPLEDPTLYC